MKTNHAHIRLAQWFPFNYRKKTMEGGPVCNYRLSSGRLDCADSFVNGIIKTLIQCEMTMLLLDMVTSEYDHHSRKYRGIGAEVAAHRMSTIFLSDVGHYIDETPDEQVPMSSIRCFGAGGR
jgi:hypothetical protein